MSGIRTHTRDNIFAVNRTNITNFPIRKEIHNAAFAPAPPSCDHHKRLLIRISPRVGIIPILGIITDLVLYFLLIVFAVIRTKL